MFTGINKDICETAWGLVLPSVEWAAQAEVTNKLAGCVVVLDPCVYYTGQSVKELPVIHTECVNDPGSDFKYVQIAHYKAWLTFKHRLPSSVIQQQYPYLFANGDTKWGGSTIDAGGLIVAFSGVQAVFDEMIAEWMASAVRALCRWQMTKPDGVMSQDTSFIGEG